MREDPLRFEDLVTEPSFQAWVRRSDPEAVRYWEDWLARHPEHAGRVAEAKEVVLALEAGRPTVSPEQAVRSWEAFAARLESRPSPERRLAADRRSRAPRSVRPGRRTLAAVAIGCLLLAVGGLLLSGVFAHEESYATGSDEIRRVQLRDGSTVVLNANSYLTYRRGFLPGAPREAFLEGEGYFDVRHLPGAGVPFRVHANEVQLEVLGTSFNVKSRRGQTEVVLESGSVRIRHETRPDTLVMQPGDLIQYAPEGTALVRRGVDPARYVGWVDHLLIFDETSVDEIARLIEDRYGLRVVLLDPALRERTLTGEIIVREVDFLLDVMKASLGLQVRREGDTLYLDSAP